MNSTVTPQNLENLHPSLWRASQLGHATTRCIDTGYLPLSKQLPGGGWPTGACVELLVPRPGIGELRLLAPALSKVADKKIFLLQPPYVPHIISLAGLGMAPSSLIWLKSEKSAAILQSTGDVLRGGAGAALLWANHIRPENLRRLNLAAQSGETLFFIFRPLAAAQDASPSPLRLSLQPADGGIEVGFVKRRGSARDTPLLLPLGGPLTVKRPAPAPAPARELPVEAHLQTERAVTL